MPAAEHHASRHACQLVELMKRVRRGAQALSGERAG
jgi:hypothetical protein